ncbi:MAG: SDR family NAD(P)-dependent oxidoreductase, partial [Phycisphaerales bacterium]|nr:SDR family NAD(P)-dependent oxidoreductase [Phycisphaerales bacterium]
VRAAGGRAITVRCDVVDPAQCRELVARTVEAFGSLYCMYANAGYGVETAIDEMSDDSLRAIFEVNFFGTVNAVRPAIEQMRRQPLSQGRRGHIVICSSCLSKMSIPYYSAYSASKAAQNHIGRAMDFELAPSGIRVSTVNPIGTRTEFFEICKGQNGGADLVNHSRERFMQEPTLVSSEILSCLRRYRPEVWTGVVGRLTRVGMAVCVAFPGLENRRLRKMINDRRCKAAAAKA